MFLDAHLPRFVSYLALFTFFMLVLVFSSNFLLLFVGWEGVGLCSYLLINFWFTRIKANKGALLALIMNRFSDVGLSLGIYFVFTNLFILDFNCLFLIFSFYLKTFIYFFNFKLNLLNCICFCLFVGCIGKSAQIGLHTWLVFAMEGPTPVSALIHAATMVTAGIFLIARCSFLFDFVPNVLVFIGFVGSFTCFFSGLLGIFQSDLKRIIAFSTSSQLGYMFFSMSTKNYLGSFFHLFNHAWFKALLFLGSGLIIHSFNNEQDVRKLGALNLKLRFSYILFFLGSFCLMGIPYFSGFYSKDFLLEFSFCKSLISCSFVFYLGVLSAFLTSFYSVRLFVLVFLKKNNFFLPLFFKVHKTEGIFLLLLFVLCFLSLAIGYFFQSFFVSLGSNFFGFSVFYGLYSFLNNSLEFIVLKIKVIPLVFSCFGCFLAVFIYFRCNFYLLFLKLNFFFVFLFLSNKFFFDKVYNSFLVNFFIFFVFFDVFRFLDKGFFEFLGPRGFIFLINAISYKYIQAQNGV